MKRLIACCLMILLCASSISATSVMPIVVEGEQVYFDEKSGMPFVDSENRTQVPFRKLLEAIGASVTWNQKTYSAEAVLGGVHLSVPIGKDYLLRNGDKIYMDTKSRVVEQRTFLPLRFILEAFGYGVYWNGNAVILTEPMSVTKNDYNHPTIMPTYLMLSPDTISESAVRVSFELPNDSGEVEIIVFDETGQFYTKTIASESAYTFDNQTYYRYEAQLTSLIEGHSYGYIISSNVGYSALYDFETIDDTETTTICLLGDAQGYKQSQYTQLADVYRIADYFHEIDLTLLAGDVVDQGDSYLQWDYFDHAMSRFTSKSLFASAQGNHDVKGSNTLFLQRFSVPDNNAGLELTYYIDLPYMRLAIINTEDFSSYDAQKAWLKQIMEEAPTQFKVVLMHRSVYPMLYNESFIRDFADTFESADIDLVLSGHDHIYSRTTMEKDSKVALNEGVTYLVSGSGSGSKFYEQDLTIDRYWSEVVYDENIPVYIIMESESDTLKVMSYGIKEGNRVLIDQFVLVQ